MSESKRPSKAQKRPAKPRTPRPTRRPADERETLRAALAEARKLFDEAALAGGDALIRRRRAALRLLRQRWAKNYGELRRFERVELNVWGGGFGD